MSILVVVESPAKIAKLSQLMGKNYVFQASLGSFRDLDPKKMSINFDNNFEPTYVIMKPAVVKNLKAAMSRVKEVYIASDPDREGESIAQAIYDVLKPKRYQRLRFHSITKEAVMTAVKNMSKIDSDLVNAQKARRVLDRLYGYLISPLLQKQVGGRSAGRVQSVVVRIIVDRETEIKTFMESNSTSSFFRVHGLFSNMKGVLYEIRNKPTKETYQGKNALIPFVQEKIISFLKLCLKSEFTIHSVTEKMATRSPSPPFTTATMQQEAHRKLAMPVDFTMKCAQKLYEAGYITYMRTDSVEISKEGHEDIRKVIEKEYGLKFYQKNTYPNKSANSQESHEAIRPTHPDLLQVDDMDAAQSRLYELIWKRTIASQMKDAQIKVGIVQIDISSYAEHKFEPYYYFQSQMEQIIFLGFMKVYSESEDDVQESDIMTDFKGKLPKVGSKVKMEEIVAKQDYLRPPVRYVHSSLVKKMVSLGIGRPSTFDSSVKTILERSYVKIGDVGGTKKEITTFSIKASDPKTISQESSFLLLGKESKKLQPTELGIAVNDFLVKKFPQILDYKFTAKMEEELDDVSNGQKVWHLVVKNFYQKLKPTIEALELTKGAGDRLLGTDSDGNEIFATKTKWGPALKKKVGEKMVYAKIEGPLDADTISLKDASKLFTFPKNLGEHDGSAVLLQKGKFGFYLMYGGQNYAVLDDKITLGEAIKVIDQKKSSCLAEFEVKKRGKTLKVAIIEGKFGPYIQATDGTKRTIYPIPKNLNAKDLTEAQVLKLMVKRKSGSGSKKSFKKS